MALSTGAKVALWVGGGAAAIAAVYFAFFYKRKPAPKAAPVNPLTGVVSSVSTALNHAVPDGLGGLLNGIGAGLSGLFKPSASDVSTVGASWDTTGYVDAGVNDAGIPNALALPDSTEVETTVNTSGNDWDPFDGIAAGDGGFASF